MAYVLWGPVSIYSKHAKRNAGSENGHPPNQDFQDEEVRPNRITTRRNTLNRSPRQIPTASIMRVLVCFHGLKILYSSKSQIRSCQLNPRTTGHTQYWLLHYERFPPSGKRYQRLLNHTRQTIPLLDELLMILCCYKLCTGIRSR